MVCAGRWPPDPLCRDRDQSLELGPQGEGRRNDRRSLRLPDLRPKRRGRRYSPQGHAGHSDRTRRMARLAGRHTGRRTAASAARRCAKAGGWTRLKPCSGRCSFTVQGVDQDEVLSSVKHSFGSVGGKLKFAALANTLWHRGGSGHSATHLPKSECATMRQKSLLSLCWPYASCVLKAK